MSQRTHNKCCGDVIYNCSDPDDVECCIFMLTPSFPAPSPLISSFSVKCLLGIKYVLILWTIFSIISLNKHLRADLSRSKYDYNILKQMCCFTSCTVNSLKPHLSTSPSPPPHKKKKTSGKQIFFDVFRGIEMEQWLEIG